MTNSKYWVTIELYTCFDVENGESIEDNNFRLADQVKEITRGLPGSTKWRVVAEEHLSKEQMTMKCLLCAIELKSNEKGETYCPNCGFHWEVVDGKLRPVEVKKENK